MFSTASLFSKDDLRPVQIGVRVFDFKEIVVNLDDLSGLFNQKYLPSVDENILDSEFDLRA